MAKPKQSNERAIEFLRDLKLACAKFPVADQVLDFYTRKLERWRLTSEQWNLALERLIRDKTDGNLPVLGDIFGYLKQAQADTAQSGSGGMLMFTMDGSRYAMPVEDISKPQSAPLGAVDIHLIIPPDKQARPEQCSAKEAREAFSAGFLQVCQDEAMCRRWWKQIYPEAS